MSIGGRCANSPRWTIGRSPAHMARDPEATGLPSRIQPGLVDTTNNRYPQISSPPVLYGLTFAGVDEAGNTSSGDLSAGIDSAGRVDLAEGLRI